VINATRPAERPVIASLPIAADGSLSQPRDARNRFLAAERWTRREGGKMVQSGRNLG
jgi:hypothetical protein